MKITEIIKNHNKDEYILDIAFDDGEPIGKFTTKNINFITRFIKKGVSRVKFWGVKNAK